MVQPHNCCVSRKVRALSVKEVICGERGGRGDVSRSGTRHNTQDTRPRRPATGSPGSVLLMAGVGYWVGRGACPLVFLALIALLAHNSVDVDVIKVIKTRHYCYAAAAAAAIIDRRRGAFGLFSKHACLPRAHIVNVSKAGWHLGKGCVSCMSII